MLFFCRAVLSVLIMFSMFQVNALLYYDLLESPDNKLVLILGETHDKAKESEIIKLSYLVFLRTLKDNPKRAPFPLIVETPEQIEAGGITCLSQNITHLLRPRVQAECRMRVIPYDPRSAESSAVHIVLSELATAVIREVTTEQMSSHYNINIEQLGGFVESSHDTPGWESFRKHIKKGRIHSETIGLTLDFLKALESDATKLHELSEKYKDNAPLNSLYRAAIERFETAQKKIKLLIDTKLKNEKLAAAMYKLFVDCKTPSQRLEAYDQCMQLFGYDTDANFLECFFLDKLLSLLEKESSVGIFAGVHHATQLSKLFLELGYKRIDHKSIRLCAFPVYSLYKPSEEFGFGLQQATLRLLAHSMQNIPANCCQACYKTPDKLLSCSRCKNARYCNEECQKKDWPHHKEPCKAQAIVLPSSLEEKLRTMN